MESLVPEIESDIRTINVANLIYAIHRDNNFVLFMTHKIYLMDGCFEDLLKILPEQFISIYRQTIINLDFIEKIELSKRRIIIDSSRSHRMSKRQFTTLCEIFDIRTD